MGEITYGRGYVYTIQYHIVWCTKYRHKILCGDLGSSLKETLRQIAENNYFRIEEMETDMDHIHLLIDCSPQHYIPDMLKVLKGVSARRLFKAHPETKKDLWGGHLWNPSYFIATVSDNTEEQIRGYIKGQKIK